MRPQRDEYEDDELEDPDFTKAESDKLRNSALNRKAAWKVNNGDLRGGYRVFGGSPASGSRTTRRWFAT